jgi:cell wall-associated NlpC family hydrolase
VGRSRSGLVRLLRPDDVLLGAAGVSLPHSSSAQYSVVQHVAISDLQPGDLVFYYSPISHVGIYIGGGRVIDAPYPGLSVHISGLYSMRS